MTIRPASRYPFKLAAVLAAVLLLGGCGGGAGPGAGGGRGGRGPHGPPQVGYVVVQLGSAPIVQDLPARVSAFQISEVRPQVNGVILKQLFQEGSTVKQGQTLYQIDPSIYQAQASQAQANLQSARAQAEATRTLAARYKPLVEQQAISKQDYTNALAQAREAQAAVAQNTAAVHTAHINLRWTRVPAPITGRIGISNFTVGALVTSGQTQPLTTIARLDPVYVDIQQSASDLLALRRSLAQGGTVPTRAEVRLELPDGSDYGYTGTVEFSEVVVDQATGTVTIRARFPNPQSILLPGMFVRTRFAQAVNTAAILVPQQAVSRDPQGNASLYVVGPGNHAVQRMVVADRTQGSDWVVTQGLAPGEKVITQGLANVKDGVQIRPVPASTPQKVQAPPLGAMRRGGGFKRPA